MSTVLQIALAHYTGSLLCTQTDTLLHITATQPAKGAYLDQRPLVPFLGEPFVSGWGKVRSKQPQSVQRLHYSMLVVLGVQHAARPNQKQQAEEEGKGQFTSASHLLCGITLTQETNETIRSSHIY